MTKLVVAAIVAMGITIAGFAASSYSAPEVGLVIVVHGSGGLVPPSQP